MWSPRLACPHQPCPSTSSQHPTLHTAFWSPSPGCSRMVSPHLMPRCQTLLALDLGSLLGGGDVHFVPGCVCVCRANCRSRLELEQEAQGEPGWIHKVPGVVVPALLPILVVRRMRKQPGRDGPLPPHHSSLGQFG